jgi:uracil-DNA glycosylase
MSALTFVEEKYSWKTLTLWDFLTEGNIPSDWKTFFTEDDVQIELQKISKYLHIESKEYIIYPPIHQVFRSFISLNKIKLVVLAMDPYHNGTTEYDGSAIGLCFSVKPSNKINPSLKNIYKELKNNGFKPQENGDLTHLPKQGVMLLNTSLSVRHHKPDSHTKIWKKFSEKLITYINNNTNGCIFLLMGSKAQHFQQYISSNNYIVKSTHPSPFSCLRCTKTSPAFIGSGVFTKINDILEQNNKTKILW